ncbi:MFS transporter [Geodermatophilus sp. SYSU D01180]
MADRRLARRQVVHGREREAEESFSYVEHEVEAGRRTLPAVDGTAIELKPSADIGYAALPRVLFEEYPSRAVHGATLMITRSFLYDAISFTYVLVPGTCYDVGSGDAPLFLIAFAVGNLAGPFLLGHLFDTVGREEMIAGTYVLSGVLLAITACPFDAGALDAVTQTIAWPVVFSFASAGASSAHPTVSEIFPLEARAEAIAVFFAIARCSGTLDPVVHGSLTGDGSEPTRLFRGYLLGAAVTVLGGVVAAVPGVSAEGRSLEDVATPFAARRPGTRAEGSARPRC